ncbi:MAG: multidrug efflux pump subunit AcrB, partial [Granulosicoccus sp.]
MHGLIAWFARNSVAANLLMIFVIVWGLSALTTRIPVEVFPSFELDSVNVSIPFRGATPSEVEVGVTVKVEEAIQSVEGIKSMTSTANEGIGTVFVQVASGYDPEKILDDIKQRVDGISTFSSEVGIPRITIPSANREVISVVVAGAMPEKELRLIAARVRDDIEALPNVSTVSVSGARSYEIGIEISQRSLEGYGLTLAAVSQAIEASSLDLAAGAITTGSGEVLLRTRGQAYEAADFGRIVVRSGSDGTRVTISDIATIKDGFEEAQIEQQFNGQNSIEIDVYRTGLQSAITVADAV